MKLLPILVSGAAATECLTHFELVDGTCFFIDQGWQNWAAGKAACEALSDHGIDVRLGVPTSTVQNEWLGASLEKGTYTWLAGRNPDDADTWVDTEGNQLTFFDWQIAPGQPDGPVDSCMALYKHSGEWVDENCDSRDGKALCAHAGLTHLICLVDTKLRC